jgi:hypothetical protein
MRKNLGGYNQLAGQGIFSRFRAPMHVGDGTNQQKYTSVLGARGTLKGLHNGGVLSEMHVELVCL